MRRGNYNTNSSFITKTHSKNLHKILEICKSERKHIQKHNKPTEKKSQSITNPLFNT
jgi:hypothetical protein